MGHAIEMTRTITDILTNDENKNIWMSTLSDMSDPKAIVEKIKSDDGAQLRQDLHNVFSNSLYGGVLPEKWKLLGIENPINTIKITCNNSKRY